MRGAIFSLFFTLLLGACMADDEPMASESPPPAQDDTTMHEFHGLPYGALSATKFGNTARVIGGIVAGQPPLNTTLLLEADLEQDAPRRAFEVGSWVLAIDALEVETNWPTGFPMIQVAPLYARISFGIGGASHVMYVDAIPNALIHLPTNTVRVELGWDRLPFFDPSLPPWALPTSVLIRGTIYRGTTRALAHKTYLCPRETSLAPAVTIVQGDVPPFARSVMVYGSDLVLRDAAPPAPANPDTTELWLRAGNNLIQRMYTPDLVGFFLAGTQVPVTGLSTAWTLIFPSGAPPYNGLFAVVDFEVGG